MRKILLTVFLIVLVIGGVLIFMQQKSNSCTPVFPLTQSKEMASLLDKQATQFASTTVDITDRSAEGGTQITFAQNGIRKIVEQRFYGETGKSYMRFYYDGNKIFEIVKLNLMYAVPLSVNNSGTVKSSDERNFYLDPRGWICDAEVNGVSQLVGKDMQDMIQEYIAGII